jgi:hypothetical protein
MDVQKVLSYVCFCGCFSVVASIVRCFYPPQQDEMLVHLLCGGGVYVCLLQPVECRSRNKSRAREKPSVSAVLVRAQLPAGVGSCCV